MIKIGRGGYALALFLLLVCGIGTSLATGGRSDVFLSDLRGILTTAEMRTLGEGVMMDIRVPRTMVACAIGINLSLAGLILQAVTRNALASPGILGINQGAAFGMVLGLVVPAFAGINLNIMAILGAFAAGVSTFTIAGGFTGRINGLRLILGGVAVGAMAYAMVRFSYTLDDDLSRQIVLWTVGSVSDMRAADAWPLGVWAGSGCVATYLLSHRLNLMALGEMSAKGLGADPRWTLLFGALIAAALTGVSVAVVGPIAFVGLVVPNMCRILFGTDHRVLVPFVAMAGASLMAVSDTVSKWVNAPFETPIGVIVALIGAPYFLYQTLFAKDLG